MLSKNIETFIGCDSDYTDAEWVIFGAPVIARALALALRQFATKVLVWKPIPPIRIKIWKTTLLWTAVIWNYALAAVIRH